MARYSLFAALAACALCVPALVCAYSGDMDGGGTTPPWVMSFDTARAETSSALESTAAGETTSSAAKNAASDRPPPAATDQFQCYFDQHYRAHLALDAAPRRHDKIE